MNTNDIIKKVKNYLDKKGISYDKEDIRVSYKENDKDRNDIERPLYTVAFDVGPIFSEYKGFFMFVDGRTFELLYMMGPHGYVEI